MSEYLTVTVLNLSKYNPRKDVDKSSWVRFEIDFFDNPKFFDFSPEERMTWMYILCYAIKANGALEIIPTHYINAMNGHLMHNVHEPIQSSPQTCINPTRSMQTLHRTLEKLKRRSIVTVRTSRGRYADVTDVRTNGRTEVRTEDTHAQGVLPVEDTNALHWLADVWNKHRGELPEVKEVSAERLAKIRLRLKKCDDPGVWARVVQKLADSDFCNGRVKGSTWRASFDFLLRPETRVKALEGQYDNRAKSAAQIDWMVEANIAMDAVRKYGSNGGSAAEKEIGPARLKRIRQAGGFHRIGQMPANEFSLKTLAGLLKAADEQLTQTQESK